MKKSHIKLLAALILAVSFVFTQFTVMGEGVSDPKAYSDYLNSIMDMVKERYNGTPDDQKLIEGSLKGMLGTLDPYTTYFTKEEAKGFFEEIDGSFDGIGISMEKEGDYLVIVKVFSGSPAEKAGLLHGDIILSADGTDLTGASTEKAVSLIKVPSGSKVTLQIRRDNKGTPIKFEITRDKITVDPVTYDIKGNIGYIKLDIFNINASQGINNALAEMDKRNITRIILDLRDNPGGEVSEAVAIAQNFIPAGVITKLDFKSEKTIDQIYSSTLSKLKYKLAVLVNGNSASASEILTGAVQDTKAGTIIGTKTFGKAKVQNIYPLLTPEAFEKYSVQTGVKVVDAYDLYEYGIIPKDSDVMGWTKITTGYYYTPKGRMIDGTGLLPDITAEDIKPANGINVRDIHTLSKSSVFSLNSIGNDVYNAERILKARGFAIGIPDTKLDSRTFAAIKRYQKNNGMKPDGIMGPKTQKALNMTLDRLINEYDKQYSKAVELLSK